VEGVKIEGFARRTNWDNDDSVERLRDIVRKMGIARELERQNIEPGDTVEIGINKLTWL
jgi:GTPase